MLCTHGRVGQTQLHIFLWRILRSKKFLIVFCFCKIRNPPAKKANCIWIPPAFLPRPLLRAGNQSRQSEKSKSPEKTDFRFAESELKPRHLPEYLEGKTPKKNVLSIFRKNRVRANPNSKRHFSLVSAEALRGGGGASSFALEVGSSKLYNLHLSQRVTLCKLKLHPRRGVFDDFKSFFGGVYQRVDFHILFIYRQHLFKNSFIYKIQ